MREIENGMDDRTAFMISQSIFVPAKFNQSDKENFDIFHSIRG